MSKKQSLICLAVFALIEFGLLLVVLLGEGKVVEGCSYSAIVFAFVFSLVFVSFKHKAFVIQLALLFTALSDLFLVFGSIKNQAVAMSFFSITQVLYFVKLLMDMPSKKIRLANLTCRIIAIVGVLIATLVVLGNKADYVSLISMFYFANIVLNMIFAFIGFKNNPYLAIGLLFFVICDLFIGLQSAIGVYIEVDPNSIIYQIVFSSFNWAWLFYIPSQVFIVFAAYYSLNKQKKLKA